MPGKTKPTREPTAQQVFAERPRLAQNLRWIASLLTASATVTARALAGCAEVGRIARDQPPPSGGKIEKMFQPFEQRGVQRTHAPFAFAQFADTQLRRGMPKARILLRTVRMLTPSISAARVRFPPVRSSVFR